MPTVRFQLRRDPAAAWASVNPTLNDGEPAIETDTRKIKFGDGTSPWNMLSYFAGGVASVAASGGSTGMTFTGGPITGSGTLTLGGTLDETAGGTGFSSYIAGDLIYAVNGTALARLGVGVANALLGSNGTLPQWQAATGTSSPVRATQPQFTSTIGVGVAAAASGSGVSFPSAQSASTDPNTLDDYEEGTWTPTVTAASGSITTVGAVSGTYTKVGRKVTATATITITNNGTGAGNVSVSLPFSSMSGPVCIGQGRDNATGKMLQAIVAAGSSAMTVFTYDNAYPGSTGGTFFVTVTYFTAT